MQWVDQIQVLVLVLVLVLALVHVRAGVERGLPVLTDYLAQELLRELALALELKVRGWKEWG